MKAYLPLFFFCVLSKFTFSQDTLIYLNGQRELINVISLDVESIRFTKFQDSSKVVYNKSASLVQSVIYSDGKIFYFKKYEEPLPVASPNYMKNFISFDIFDPFLGQISLRYQHTFKWRNITLAVPISTSFNYLKGSKDYKYSRNGYYNQCKLYSFGVEAMMFPFSAANSGFAHGMSLEMGAFKEYKYVYKDKLVFHTVFGNCYYRIGYMKNDLRHFAFGVFGDIGIGYATNQITSLDGLGVSAKIKIEIGYTF